MTAQEVRDTYVNQPLLPSSVKVQGELAAQVAELVQVLRDYIASQEKPLAKKVDLSK